MNANSICRRVLNSRAVKGTKRVLRDHGADIFSVLAGIGVIATGVSAYNAGRNEKMSESDECERNRKVHDLLLPVSFGTGTIGCIYAARKFGKLKEESLLAACSALAVYAGRKERIGVQEPEPTTGDIGAEATDIEDTGSGGIIFIETFTDRRFKASMEVVEHAMRKLQDTFSICGYVSLNDFYRLLGIEETASGEVLGWTKDQMVLDPDYVPGESYFCLDDALTSLAIQLDEQEDGTRKMHYNILPIGSLVGIGPCNY